MINIANYIINARTSRWNAELTTGEVINRPYIMLDNFHPEALHYGRKKGLELISRMLANPRTEGLLIREDTDWNVTLEEMKERAYYMSFNQVAPIRALTPKDVKHLFVYKVFIRIAGTDYTEFTDAGRGYCGYNELYPGYVELENTDLSVDLAGSKRIELGNARDGIWSVSIYPKEHIEKIGLKRYFIDINKFDFEEIKYGGFYDVSNILTGESDVYMEADFGLLDDKMTKSLSDLKAIDYNPTQSQKKVPGKKLVVKAGCKPLSDDTCELQLDLTEAGVHYIIPASVKWKNTEYKVVRIAKLKNGQKATLELSMPLKYDYLPELYTVTLPDTVTELADGAFEDCKSLTAIKLPNGLIHIGRRAFKGCRGLSDINLPKGVSVICDETFTDCKFLDEITIPEQVRSIGKRAFKNTDLRRIVFPQAVTEIDDEAFADCHMLSGVLFSDNITRIGENAFANCKFFQLFSTPQKIYNRLCAFQKHKAKEMSWDNMVKQVFSAPYEFWKNDSIPIFDLPNSLVELGKGAFKKCGDVRIVNIELDDITIKENTFFGCSELKKVYVSDGNIRFEDNAFGHRKMDILKIS